MYTSYICHVSSIVQWLVWWTFLCWITPKNPTCIMTYRYIYEKIIDISNSIHLVCSYLWDLKFCRFCKYEYYIILLHDIVCYYNFFFEYGKIKVAIRYQFRWFSTFSSEKIIFFHTQILTINYYWSCLL